MIVALFGALRVSGGERPAANAGVVREASAGKVHVDIWPDMEQRNVFYIVGSENEAAALRSSWEAGPPAAALNGMNVELLVVPEALGRSTVKALEEGLWSPRGPTPMSFIDLR